MNNEVYCEKCERKYWVTPAGDCPGCGRLITGFPGFHMHPILVEPRVVRAIERMRKMHPEYRTIDGATGKCREASGQFIDVLLEEGYPVVGHGGTLEDGAMVDEMAVVNGVAHKAVRIGPVWIDWTARQFDHTERFPKVEVDQ